MSFLCLRMQEIGPRTPLAYYSLAALGRAPGKSHCNPIQKLGSPGFTRFNMNWIANTEISVIKRLRCSKKSSLNDAFFTSNLK